MPGRTDDKAKQHFFTRDTEKVLMMSEERAPSSDRGQIRKCEAIFWIQRYLMDSLRSRQQQECGGESDPTCKWTFQKGTQVIKAWSLMLWINNDANRKNGLFGLEPTAGFTAAHRKSSFIFVLAFSAQTTSIQVCIMCLLAADHSRLLHLSLCINVS